MRFAFLGLSAGLTTAIYWAAAQLCNPANTLVFCEKQAYLLKNVDSRRAFLPYWSRGYWLL